MTKVKKFAWWEFQWTQGKYTCFKGYIIFTQYINMSNIDIILYQYYV